MSVSLERGLSSHFQWGLWPPKLRTIAPQISFVPFCMSLRLQCEHQLPFCNMTAFAIHGCHLIGPCKTVEFYCTKYVEFYIFLHILTFPRNPTLALESWRDIGDEYKPFEAFLAKVGQEDSIHPSSEPCAHPMRLSEFITLMPLSPS